MKKIIATLITLTSLISCQKTSISSVVPVQYSIIGQDDTEFRVIYKHGILETDTLFFTGASYNFTVYADTDNVGLNVTALVVNCASVDMKATVYIGVSDVIGEEVFGECYLNIW